MMMHVNRERRLARRQARGLRRVEDILHAAGEIFVEQGYDHTTTQMIAQRADVSAGSLYQFFPNKEAIAQAFAAQAVEQLQLLYDETILVPEIMALPLPRFLDYLIEALVTFNRDHPGYFVLLQGATISPQLAHLLHEQRHGITARLIRITHILAPSCSDEQCEVLAVMSQRIFLALLPLIVQADEQRSRTIIRELKKLMVRYIEPMQER
jgi:AcrR family transcriptional regulator